MVEQKEFRQEFRHIVRIANTDLDGRKQILYSLRKIKGVNYMFANFSCYKANVDTHKKTGELSDDEIKRLDDVITRSSKYNIPSWLSNRRKDPETGLNMHLLSGDLKFAVENDIKMMKKVRSYKGMRHAWGQPVRGQRTKSNFRKNKGKVSLGVIKKKSAPAEESKDKGKDKKK
ncbi:MAG: 30S ribosomal protein S13 [Candidatus Woesearchaeota archaeon]